MWQEVQPPVTFAERVVLGMPAGDVRVGAPAGGLAWHEVQFANGSAVADVWHTVQRGADERGEVPETAWHGAQLSVEADLIRRGVGRSGERNGVVRPAGPAGVAGGPLERGGEAARRVIVRTRAGPVHLVADGARYAQVPRVPVRRGVGRERLGSLAPGGRVRLGLRMASGSLAGGRCDTPVELNRSRGAMATLAEIQRPAWRSARGTGWWWGSAMSPPARAALTQRRGTACC